MSDAQPPPQFPAGIPPYPPAPPPQPRKPSAQRFPTWKQALVIFGGGAALAVSACFGCLFTVMEGGGRTSAALEGLALFLAVLAFGGLVAALVGVVLVLRRILRAMFGKKEDVGGGSSDPAYATDATGIDRQRHHYATHKDGGSDSDGDSDSGGGSDGGGDGD
jgi:uncharacterized membrane protein YgcG